MGDTPQNPTLLVGVGAFGAEVLALATSAEPGRVATGGAPPSPAEGIQPGEGAADGLAVLICGAHGTASRVIVDAAAQAPLGPVLRAVSARLREMLDLGHYIASTEPSDARGPRCDVFVIADLGEPRSAELLPRLTETLAAELRAELSAVLRRGEGALAICPLLHAPRGGDRAAIAGAVRELARGATQAAPAARLQAPIWLVEDHSGRYLLSRAEVVRSFAAFLRLLLFSRLRDAEAGVRRLVELDADSSHAPFATFACATLELDHQALSELCAARIGREVVLAFREGSAATIAEIAAAAAPWVPERGRVEDALWQEGSVGSLETHLEPPAIDVPTVGWDDSPEDIVERSFGVLWRARTSQRIAAFRDEVERFKMDRLAAEIERNGKTFLSRMEADLAARLEREVAAAPRGHARALDLLSDAHKRARGYLDEVSAEVESPELGEFPDSPLDAGAAAIAEAAHARPRPYRMWAFGVIAALVGAFLTAGVIQGVLRLLFADPRAFFDQAPLGLGAWALLGGAPASFAIGAAISGSSTSYRLWKHRKRHQVWVEEARDGLDQALKRYLCRDVVGYFYRRLHAARLLWAQRIYQRMVERLEEAMAELQRVRAALGQAEDRLARDQRALEDRLAASTAHAGILFRGILAPADAQAIYADVRPADVAGLASRHLKQALTGHRWQEATFADTDRLLALCGDEVERAALGAPFQSDLPALRNAATAATRIFLRQLARKLSPPLELVEAAAHGTPRMAHAVIMPPDAQAIVEEALGEENLRGAWHLHAMSGDSRRIHLLLERRDLPLAALALATPAAGAGPSSAPPPRPGNEGPR